MKKKLKTKNQPAADCSRSDKLLPDPLFFHLPLAVLEEAGAVALRGAVKTRQLRQTIISLTA